MATSNGSGITGTPQAFGAYVAVGDITELADLNVDGFTMGTTAYSRNDDSYWQLKVSSADVDHTTVEAVLGYDELRWLILVDAAGITTLTGDVHAGPGSGSVVSTLFNIPTAVTMAGDLVAAAITAPGTTPASGHAFIYVDSTSKNLCVKDDATVVKHGIQTKASTSHQFLTAVSDAGVVAAAQPAIADISDATATGIALVTAASAAAARTTLAVDILNAGTALTNADQTIQPATDASSSYTQSTALTASRTKTLGVTSVVTGTVVQIIRRDTAAFTMPIVNGGGGAGTLFTFGSGPATAQAATFAFDGTNWVFLNFVYVSA